jgi:hypothetical protein
MAYNTATHTDAMRAKLGILLLPRSVRPAP